VLLPGLLPSDGREPLIGSAVDGVVTSFEQVAQNVVAKIPTAYRGRHASEGFSASERFEPRASAM
jgi:hypothetical protein